MTALLLAALLQAPVQPAPAVVPGAIRGRVVRADVPVLADARVALRALADLCDRCCARARHVIILAGNWLHRR